MGCSQVGFKGFGAFPFFNYGDDRRVCFLDGQACGQVFCGLVAQAAFFLKDLGDIGFEYIDECVECILLDLDGGYDMDHDDPPFRKIDSGAAATDG